MPQAKDSAVRAWAVLKAGLVVVGAVTLEWAAPLSGGEGGWDLGWALCCRAALWAAVTAGFAWRTTREESGLARGAEAQEGRLDATGGGAAERISLDAAELRHQILSPLSAVFGFLELLRDERQAGALTEQQRGYVNAMHEAMQEALTAIEERAGGMIQGAAARTD